jgi:hypothetical protein
MARCSASAGQRIAAVMPQHVIVGLDLEQLARDRRTSSRTNEADISEDRQKEFAAQNRAGTAGTDRKMHPRPDKCRTPDDDCNARAWKNLASKNAAAYYALQRARELQLRNWRRGLGDLVRENGELLGKTPLQKELACSIQAADAGLCAVALNRHLLHNKVNAADDVIAFQWRNPVTKFGSLHAYGPALRGRLFRCAAKQNGPNVGCRGQGYDTCPRFLPGADV